MYERLIDEADSDYLRIHDFARSVDADDDEVFLVFRKMVSDNLVDVCRIHQCSLEARLSSPEELRDGEDFGYLLG